MQCVEDLTLLKFYTGMSRSPRVSSSPGWTSSTAIKYQDPETLANSPPVTPTKSQLNKSSDKPKARQSILHRITNLRKSSSEDLVNKDKVTGSRVCASLINIDYCDKPLEAEGSIGDYRKPVNSDRTEEVKDGGESPPKVPSTPLKVVVSVIHHKAAQCYEVVSYDVNKSCELNRLYVPADDVSDLTKKKRISFIGGPAEESLAVKMSKIMAFTFDSKKGVSCAHIVRPDPNSGGIDFNPSSGVGRKSSIAVPKPVNINPLPLFAPKLNKNGTLAPYGRKSSIFENVKRFSIFGNNNNKRSKVTPKKEEPTVKKAGILKTAHETIPEQRTTLDAYASEDDGGSSRVPNREIPRQLSSNRLMNNMGYDKSVDTMLSEAAQMRADLAVRRAAKKSEEGTKTKKKY